MLIITFNKNNKHLKTIKGVSFFPFISAFDQYIISSSHVKATKLIVLVRDCFRWNIADNDIYIPDCFIDRICPIKVHWRWLFILISPVAWSLFFQHVMSTLFHIEIYNVLNDMNYTGIVDDIPRNLFSTYFQFNIIVSVHGLTER